MYKNFFTSFALTLAFCFLSFGAKAQFNIPSIKPVQEYMEDKQHPNVLKRLASRYDMRDTKRELKRIKKLIKKNHDALFEDKDAIIIGNPRAKITIIEFFDYNCGYCRRVLPSLIKTLRKNSDVRLILKELPILGKGSEETALIALASREQGKYFPLHAALLSNRERLSGENSLTVARQIGIDIQRLREASQNSRHWEHLQRNRELANTLGIRGTPFFIIGDRFYPGALDEKAFAHILSEIRK